MESAVYPLKPGNFEADRLGMETRGKRKRRSTPGFTVGKSDPLFQIFERHLYEFNYETRENFINSVVRDYLEFLARESKIVVPLQRRSLLESTIAEDVSDMLVRKIYGCLRVEEDKPATPEKEREAIAQENRDALVSPQEMKKRLSKLIR